MFQVRLVFFAVFPIMEAGPLCWTPQMQGRRMITMTIQYTPRGVCSRAFTIQVEDGAIQSVQIVGGCDGNLKGISSLLQGMPVDEVIRRLEGNPLRREGHLLPGPDCPGPENGSGMK